MNRINFITLLATGASLLLSACTPTVKSPDGRLSVVINTDSRTYDLRYDGKILVKGAEAQLELNDSTIAWAGKAKVSKSKKTTTEHISAPLYRQAEFDYTYNSLTLDFGNGFGMEWRVSDDGAAYRFTTTRSGETTILSETGMFNFAEDWPVTVAKSANLDWMCSFEGFYNTQKLSKGSTDSLCFMPASIACADGGLRVTIAESGVLNFPGSFLLPVEGEPAIRILHAPVPEKDYIASSTGARNYPWRILKVTTKDTDIPQDNLIYALAEPNRIGNDVSWIKPGYAAWEWWNDWGLEGTDFKPGINDETYRAYIDFAAANGLEYAILDEGWGKRGPGQNLLVPIPGLHLQELSDYARSKGVRLVLWAVFNRLYQDKEAVMSTYEDMGIAGFKPDFFNRNDQIGVERMCEIAEIAAKHHIFIDFHGAFPPMGLNRTYPNIINMEGIAGLEQCKWLAEGTDFMRHDCTLSYLRTMAGISDYTPGAMKNFGGIASFVKDYSHPGSQGTRAHQVALYGIFDSPLTMLCDSPDAYRKNQETTDFISSLPRNYTEKKVLSGVMGEYITIARKGDDGNWYVFGITDFDARTIDVALDFLPEGKYQMSLFHDGAEGPESYAIESGTISGGDTLPVCLASGGGFVIRLEYKSVLTT